MLFNKKIILFVEDETIIYRNTTITRMWAEKGKQPKVLSDFSHEKICLFGTVNIQSGSLYYEAAEKLNSETFENFLRGFLNKNNFSKKVVMVVDNVSWHRAKRLDAFLESVKEKFELLYLPPNSPDLNPQERVWRFIRKHVSHNTYFESLDKLKDTLFHFLDNLALPNTILTSLCEIT